MAIVGWVSSVHSMFYQGALSTFAPGKVAHPARRRQTWSQVPPPEDTQDLWHGNPGNCQSNNSVLVSLCSCFWCFWSIHRIYVEATSDLYQIISNPEQHQVRFGKTSATHHIGPYRPMASPPASSVGPPGAALPQGRAHGAHEQSPEVVSRCPTGHFVGIWWDFHRDLNGDWEICPTRPTSIWEWHWGSLGYISCIVMFIGKWWYTFTHIHFRGTRKKPSPPPCLTMQRQEECSQMLATSCLSWMKLDARLSISIGVIWMLRFYRNRF